MTAAKLFWGAMWRMVAGGLVCGLSCGAAVGGVIGALSVVVGYPALLSPSTYGFGDLLDPIALAIVGGFPLGAFGGALFGTSAGFVLGTLCGPVVAVLTCIFYSNPRSTAAGKWYRAVAGLACAAVALAALYVLWAARGFDTDAFVVFSINPAGTIDAGPWDLVFVTMLPMLVAAAAAFYMGARTADWWLRETRDSVLVR